MQASLILSLASLATLGAVALPGDEVRACSSSTTASAVDAKDIVTTAVEAGSFTTLVTAVKAAGLVEALQGKGPFTVFAPSDAAFAKLPKGTLADLLKPENKAKLQAVLTYHVVPANVAAKDVVKLRKADTLNGQRVMVRVQEEGGVMIDGANVVTTDIECTNGRIHVIDSVLLPSFDDIVATAKGAGTFTTLLAAAQAAGLAETLSDGGPFTVLAPTDAAFAKLPAGTVENLLLPENKEQLANILKYHVISGRVFADGARKAGKATTLLLKDVEFTVEDGTVMVQGAAVVKADIGASNGVIHAIDTVLMPR